MSDDETRDERGRFKKGYSGNPSGNAPGVAAKVAEWRQQIAERVPDIIDTLVHHVEENADAQAAKLLLDKVLPSLKAGSLPITLAAAADAGGLLSKAEAILDAALAGDLSPDTATELLTALGGLIKIDEYENLLRRIDEIEQQRIEDMV